MYIGRGINSGDAVSDHLTGSGATVYSLTHDTTTHGVVLTLDGVVQRNATDFTITGNQVTFTTAVASPIAIQIIYTGLTLSIGSPGTSTVGISQLSATSTASSSTYLRGDNSWAAIPATADEITKSSSDPTVSTNPAGGVGTVFLNTTSGEMFCLTDSTAGSNVWKNIGEGVGGVPIIFSVATGGTITTDGNFKVHTFESSGTFEITTLGHDAVAEYLVIAGGAGGGAGWNSGGGGGAGGYRTATGFSVSASSYSITIGAGSSGGNGTTMATNGSNSVFSSITSLGGGGGGTPPYYAGGQPGQNGGSGGGGPSNSSAVEQAAGNGTAGQGNNGAAGGASGYTGGAVAGGGGGAGQAGQQGTGSGSATAYAGGDGGDGSTSSITGASVTRAGGGAGAVYSGTLYGIGGTGGGGNGGRNGLLPPVNGTANLGGGGGGGRYDGGNSTGANGGSGVVIIRYQFQ